MKKYSSISTDICRSCEGSIISRKVSSNGQSETWAQDPHDCIQELLDRIKRLEDMVWGRDYAND